jgi:hypothetical protein
MDAPAILGPSALPEYPHEVTTSGVPGVSDPAIQEIQQETRRIGPPVRDRLVDARDLFDFVRGHLPAARVSALKTEGILAVVTFMLAAQGAELPPGGVTLDGARDVPIPRR